MGFFSIVLLFQPEQFGQARAGAVDGTLGRGNLLQGSGFTLCTTIVVHQGRGQGLTISIRQQDGARGAIEADGPDLLGGDGLAKLVKEFS